MIIEKHFRLYSEEWHRWRWTHIGGSDVAAVCAGYSEGIANASWTPHLKYYLDMIGENVQPFMGNVSSNMGQFLEPVITDLYRHYDKTKRDLMDMFECQRQNIKHNRIIRRQNYVWNTDYPYMSCSPDGFIYTADQNGILEVKNMTSMEADRYEERLNPAHYLQCQHNLMVSGRDFCDFVRLIDGTWMEPVTFGPDKEAQLFIVECINKFWEIVSRARQVKAEYDIEVYYDIPEHEFTQKQKYGVALLQALEPEFQGTMVEKRFIAEMLKPREEDIPMKGTQDQWQDLLNFMNNDREIKALEAKKNAAQNALIRSIVGHNVADFEEDVKGGYFSYKCDKNGKARFYVSPKLKRAL